MKYYIRGAIAVLIFSQCACAPTLPKGASVISHINLPQKLSSANPAVESRTNNLPQSNWWRMFENPDLNRLVTMALKNNPGLAKASARVRLAQAEVLRSGAAEWPHLDSDNKITRAHNSKNGNHGIYNDKTSTVGEINPLVVSYHLDLFNEDRENIAAVQAGAEAVRAEYRQSALMLSAGVIKTYFALATAEQLVSIQGEIVKLDQAAENIQISAYKAGIQPAVDTVVQKVETANAESILAALQQERAALRFALAALLGKNPDYQLPITAGTHKIPDRLQIPAHIDLDVIAQRPDIQAALWSIKHALHTENSARAAFYPNINLRALTGFNSIGLSDLFKADSFTYAFGPAINLPIFEGGALEGRLQASAAAYDIAVYTYNQSILTAVSQIATDLSALEHSKEQLEDRVLACHQSSTLVDVATSQYNSGITDKMPLIQSSIRFNSAIKAQLEETLNWLSAVTDAATALGGGFQRLPS